MKDKILIILSVFFLASCEEVIELDLSSSEPQVIIEANLDVADQTCDVKLSLSNNFYDSGEFEKIEDAEITLTSGNGAIYTFDYLGSGNYSAKDVIAEVGEQFTIQILSATYGSFTASAVTPKVATIDEITVDEFEGNPFGGDDEDGDRRLTVEWQDIVGEENFFRIQAYLNGVYLEGSYVMADDRFGEDGTLIRPFNEEFFNVGDEVEIQLLTTNEEYYDYFTAIADGGGPGFGNAAVPYNPQANFGEDALGYFGIWQKASKLVVIE